MKTITLTDEELKKLKGLLNVAIAGCLDDSIVAPFEDLRKEAIKQANEYKKNFTTKLLNLSTVWIYGIKSV